MEYSLKEIKQGLADSELFFIADFIAVAHPGKSYTVIKAPGHVNIDKIITQEEYLEILKTIKMPVVVPEKLIYRQKYLKEKMTITK